MSEVAALVALAATLAAAVARPRLAPDWAVAAVGAGRASSRPASSSAGDARRRGLRPRADDRVPRRAARPRRRLPRGRAVRGARRGDGAGRARAARGGCWRWCSPSPRGTTAVLSLDATVVLLTPVVFATAARLRVARAPHVYACSHLANSASLLLPVSNLTNLLAFEASGLSFTRFAALMALPWLVGARGRVGRARARLRARPAAAPCRAGAARRGDAGRPALRARRASRRRCRLRAQLAAGIAPVWIAAAGALALVVRASAGRRGRLVRAAEPGIPRLRPRPRDRRARGGRPRARSAVDGARARTATACSP